MSESLETRVARVEAMLGLQPDAELGWIAAIMQNAAAMYGLRLDVVRDATRAQPAVRARWATAWTARQISPVISTRALAQALRKADHGTIIHALREAEHLRATSPEFVRLTDNLVRMARERAARMEREEQAAWVA